MITINIDAGHVFSPCLEVLGGRIPRVRPIYRFDGTTIKLKEYNYDII
jgi:hypothetical protein